jgi:TonB-linked SusC/RagA family outer membrane protein
MNILKRMKLKLLFSGLFLICSLVITAQERTIKGVVTDMAGEPIIGANVMVKNTILGTATDLDGNYTLVVPESATALTVSYIGMKDIEVPITGAVVNIVMEEDVSSLDELVVIGYGTQRRRDLTGSIASVRGDAITTAPVTNVAQALQGKLPGVNVISQDGRPDAEISIRVRGGGSISQSNDPLVLIDGIPGSINDIPGDMVESIDVLKDASSTAIYGARGANGVILVTTKRGKEGKVSVSYSGYTKFNTPSGYIKTLDPYDYLVYKWGLLDTYFGTTYTTPFQQLFGIGGYTGSNSSGIDAYRNVSAYNLQKDVYNSSFSHNHDLTITGGSEKTKILFALNYLDEDGMKLNSYTKRASASFKLDQKISDNLNFNLDVRYIDRQTMGNESTQSGFGSSLSGAYRFRPIATRDIKGDLSYLLDASLGEETFVMDDMFNPVAVIKDHENLSLKQSIRGTAGVNWTIINGLNYRTELTLSRDYAQDKNWRGPTPFGNEESYLDGEGKALFAGNADYRKSDGWKMRWSNTLNYDITLDDIHRLSVLGGQEVTNSGGSFMRIQGDKYPANFTKENAFAMISQYGTNLRISSGATTPARILSFFGRVNYSLLDKYMLTATFRADGSSTFSPEHRWGYFPAAALAWRVSDESFMKGLDWLDDMKLRVSYGQVGNDAISADQWSQLWATESDILNQYTINNTLVPAYKLASDQMANRNLKWETTVTRNIGIDYTLLNNRIWGTIDVYKNTTKDLLMLTDIPSITGFTTSFANIGQTSNKGVELSISGGGTQQQGLEYHRGCQYQLQQGKYRQVVGRTSERLWHRLLPARCA